MGISLWLAVVLLKYVRLLNIKHFKTSQKQKQGFEKHAYGFEEITIKVGNQFTLISCDVFLNASLLC